MREFESAPNPLTGRVPFRRRCRCGGTEADHGKTAPEAHGGAQAARRAAAQRGGSRLRGGRARDRRRPAEPRRPGQKGPGRGARRRGEPLPDGRGPAAARARERAAQKGERDAFESERLLRRQAAAGAGAKEARFAFILLGARPRAAGPQRGRPERGPVRRRRLRARTGGGPARRP